MGFFGTFQEIMYPAVPTGVAVTEDGLHLLVYSDTHIDVFDVHSGDWVQVRSKTGFSGGKI